MFNPKTGYYYDTIKTENVNTIIHIIDRLDKIGRTCTILNDDPTHIIVICQMECDASDIARAMIESGWSFEYQYIKIGE